MNGELKALVRKELRGMRGTYVGVTILLGIAGLVWPAARTMRTLAGGQWIAAPFLGAILSAFLGAVTFAGEKESGTIHFLAGLPVRRREIWRSKLATTAPAVLVVAVLSVILPVLRLAALPREAWEAAAPAALLAGIGILTCAVLYSFGVLFSLIVDTVVIATLGAVALYTIVAGAVMLVATGILNRYPIMSPHVTQGVVFGALGALGIAIAVGALFAARRLFCGTEAAMIGDGVPQGHLPSHLRAGDR